MGKAIEKIELEKSAENVTTNTSFGDATQHQPHVAKLPQTQLRKLDGKFTDWIAFIDQFDTAVHLNTKLSNSQRLVYLKNCLSGHPEKLIKAYHELTATRRLHEIYSSSDTKTMAQFYAHCKLGLLISSL